MPARITKFCTGLGRCTALISGKSGIRDTGFGSSGTRAARAAAGQGLIWDLSVKQNGKYTLSCELQKD